MANDTRAKRGHGEGSFRERSPGHWEGRVTLPNGQRRSVYGNTKREVQAKILDLRQRQQAGVVELGRSQRLEQFLAGWLDGTAKLRLRPRTWDGYESAVRVRILPRIGKVRLDSVGAEHLQRLYAHLLADGLSPTSVRLTHAVLHRAFNDAVAWGLIPVNPGDRVTSPRPRRLEVSTLSELQLKELLSSVDDQQRHSIYLLAATTGLRQGELLGLNWADLDLGNHVLAVRRTLQPQKGRGLVLAEVKTARSRRTVALSSAAGDELRSHRSVQLEARLKAGPAWEDTGLVFTNAEGRPMKPQKVTRDFQADLAAAGLPRLRFHDLRHTAATLLLADGRHPKVVQEMLGHANIAVTMDTYSHVLPHMQKEAAGTFDRILRGGTSA